MKIAVYSPALNEEHNVDDWVRSATGADYIVLTDTGSTDRTWQKARNFHDVDVHRISLKPWRFDLGHNIALANVPADADVCIPLHLDDRLPEGWREMIESCWTLGETTKLEYTYQFSEDHSFITDRIHARHNHVWRYPAHEGIYPVFPKNERKSFNYDLVITQHQDRSKDRSSALHLLLLGVQENPLSARMAFYLGREWTYYGKWELAVQQLERYFRLPGERWPAQDAQAAEALATAYRGLGRPTGERRKAAPRE